MSIKECLDNQQLAVNAISDRAGMGGPRAEPGSGNRRDEGAGLAVQQGQGIYMITLEVRAN